MEKGIAVNVGIDTTEYRKSIRQVRRKLPTAKLGFYLMLFSVFMLGVGIGGAIVRTMLGGW